MSDQISTSELFFEILRRKTHIFCDVKENATVLELKKIIEGILKVPINKQILKKQTEDGFWHTIEDRQTLSECGYTPQNSRAQAPAPLALVVANEEEDVIIEPLSIPPPVPDAMRPEQAATNEQ
uniref:BMA-ELB-1 n=1 Tax=Brugia malayi TaxID=6279 RepID=A0A0J9Y418_BRUMA|nr:BMA-ELB-1 [Brugia malayi]